jgi:hypothetical protein
VRGIRRRESAALIVGQTKPFLAELFLEDAVFLDEVVDDLRLVAVGPAGEGGEEELKTKEVGHVTTAIGGIGALSQMSISRLGPSSAE